MTDDLPDGWRRLADVLEERDDRGPGVEDGGRDA